MSGEKNIFDTPGKISGFVANEGLIVGKLVVDLQSTTKKFLLS